MDNDIETDDCENRIRQMLHRDNERVTIQYMIEHGYRFIDNKWKKVTPFHIDTWLIDRGVREGILLFVRIPELLKRKRRSKGIITPRK